MDFEGDNYTFIDEFEFIDVERKENKGYLRRDQAFVESLGLKFMNYYVTENQYFYKFKILDKQKWFVAKIKYGF